MLYWTIFLIFSFGLVQVSESAPQNALVEAYPTVDAFPSIRDYLQFIVRNPPSTQDVNLVTIPLVREFFKNATLVEGLVTCFNFELTCEYEGIAYLIDVVSSRFDPGSADCINCGKDFQKILTISQNQFTKNYPKQWSKLLPLIADIFGSTRRAG